ncbi:3-hydroxyacyl-[acyl-carrier-protein] dehydratase FabZ [Clostridia bacterium]|nr:3-hydroxyacyl-[acyl-carrier-protein] dehydratase FabZ [Clostridia bacterium]
MQFGPKEVLAMLPHKPPFVLLDKVIECDPGKRAVGIKNVTIDQPFFAGHFENEPIMPGVMIVESAAQCAVVLYATGAWAAYNAEHGIEYTEDMADHIYEEILRYSRENKQIGYLAEIKAFKFLQVVRPGDTMRIEVFRKGTFGLLSLIEVKIFVEGKLAAEGKITLAERQISLAER